MRVAIRCIYQKAVTPLDNQDKLLIAPGCDPAPDKQ